MFSKSHQRAPRPPFACRCVEITIRVYKNFHGLNPTMVFDGILGKWREREREEDEWLGFLHVG